METIINSIIGAYLLLIGLTPTLSIMQSWALIICFFYYATKKLTEFIIQKAYWKAAATVLCTLIILEWFAVLVMTVVAAVKIHKYNKNTKQETKTEWEPSPGSTADYDRWKADREQQTKDN